MLLNGKIDGFWDLTLCYHCPKKNKSAVQKMALRFMNYQIVCVSENLGEERIVVFVAVVHFLNFFDLIQRQRHPQHKRFALVSLL